jgi:hypothetical protein
MKPEVVPLLNFRSDWRDGTAGSRQSGSARGRSGRTSVLAGAVGALTNKSRAPAWSRSQNLLTRSRAAARRAHNHDRGRNQK